MNKKNFIKGTTLPVALFFTIATFAPAWGLQTASAAIEVVQQQSTIKSMLSMQAARQRSSLPHSATQQTCMAE